MIVYRMLVWLVVEIAVCTLISVICSSHAAFLYTTSRVVEVNLVFLVILKFPPLLGYIRLFMRKLFLVVYIGSSLYILPSCRLFMYPTVGALMSLVPPNFGSPKYPEKGTFDSPNVSK